MLLLFAVVVSGFTHEWGDAAIVLTIVAATVGIGYAKEYSAQTSLAALRARVKTRTSVLRDGRPRLVSMGEHFNHLKLAVFDERFSIHGSTNLNYRSLEDDKDFELVVYIDDRRFALQNLREVRDVDVRHARRITERDVRGLSAAALRMRIRHPWTQLMLSRRVL